MSRWSTLPSSEPARPFASLVRWIAGYKQFHGPECEAPNLDNPTMRTWRMIALGGMKRCIVANGTPTQAEMDQYIDWYWNVFARRLAKVLNGFSPNTPASKSFQQRYAEWKGKQSSG